MPRSVSEFVCGLGRLAALALPMLLSGCGSSAVNAQGDAAAARATLTQVLDAWKEGKTPEDLKSAKPVVFATDPDWNAGRKLSQYEITEEPARNGGEWRVFAQVTVTGDGAPKAAQRVCYSVSPGDPAVVSRSDYLH